MNSKNKFQKLVSMLFLAAILLSNFQTPVVSAQGKDGLKRQLNAESGKVSFIGPESGRSLPALKAFGTFLRPQDPGMALAKRFAPEFGIKNPERELTQIKKHQSKDGRVTVRYQQKYEGIPVLAGELIVNTNERGDLYSMSGEVSPGLTLQTEPKIDSAQAAETALQALAKWYNQTPADFNVSEPELWIFDESLLKPSTRPIELVWRMEVTPKELGMPVRELVLVNAARGNISIHFNQADTAFGSQTLAKDQNNIDRYQNMLLTYWPVYFEIALDETRGWIYGSDSSGNKVDVISTTSLELVKSFNLSAGATPKGIALSPDGSELAIAQSGAGSIIFVNPDTGSTVATIIPDVTIGPNKPWDVIYGRPGRLYSTGNPDSGGFEYIHVMDTTAHIEISKSSHIVRSAPRLSISADKNSLYANDANFSPQKLYKYDVSTDTIPNPTSTPHTTGFSATMHIVDPGTGYIFTNAGQVWTPDLTVQLGSTGLTGEVTPIPNRDAIAVATTGNYDVVFVSNDTLYTLSTYTLPQGSAKGALVAQSDGNKLFVSTLFGIVAIDLTSFPPGTPGTLPTGSLPYSDIVLDETNGVLYGSNTTGHKIDVISLSTLQMVDEIRLINGASPKGMDLSPAGNELAVALSGADQIAFIDTETRTLSAYVFPEASDAPFDVKYGRPGRLYSSGSPYSSGFEYIHVIDTTTHTNVSKSSFIIRAGPSLAISADKNYLLANEQFSPNKLYRFNVTTDTIPSPTSTPHVSGFSANTYIVLDDESKVFTNTGQVWSNPLDLNLSTQLGMFNTSGYLVEMPSLGWIAVLGNSGLIKFVNTTNYSITSTTTLPSVSMFGPSALDANEDKLFLNTNNGIMALNVDPELPSTILVESGANQSTALQTQLAQPLKAKVQNFLGQPLTGIIVSFTAPASGASAVFASTSTNTSTAITDANGIAASSAVTTNNIEGAFTIFATTSGVGNSADFQITNYDTTVPKAILVVSGANQFARPQMPFGLPLKAKVQNILNQPMAGLAVTFTAPATGASGIFVGTNTNTATAITDMNGIATSPAFSANAIQGGYIVQATVNGLASSAEFGMTNSNAFVNTYTANNTTLLPGTLLCHQTNPNCTGGANLHADAAHKYAIGTYALYFGKHDRNSIDNAGMTIKSTVHYDVGYSNAFWDGTQAVYGDGGGWPLSDDVVAHELTHGVTQYESSLFYYYQSGAINESFSDLWGEYYDQTNGQGNDSEDVKWLIGEDVSGIGTIRSMINPPAYGDPDRMMSGYYYNGDGDNGGVHYNSGINNKAVSLMVDGGSFNGKTVTALGWDKIAAIYYEANTNLLTGGSNYSDLYYALQGACKDLTGQYGITVGNCDQVKNALDAVEMSSPAYGGFYPDAPVCAPGQSATNLFQDNFESGTGNWDILGSAHWSLEDWYATSPTHMMWGDDYYGSSDSRLSMKTSVFLPAGPSYYLHFHHAFLFEYEYTPVYYDGGVLEYSINNGATWLDAATLFSAGKNYTGVVVATPGTSNTLAGRSAFVGDSHGYVSSRYNLTSLAGQTVKFRWRFATDQYFGFLGWTVDDVQLYTCAADVAAPTVTSIVHPVSSNPNLLTTNFLVTFSENVTGVSKPDFALTSTGVTGASITSVSGSGTTYTVTVHTGAGNGSIRLDVADNDSIKDGAGNFLGGSGASNGNFISGETYIVNKTVEVLIAGQLKGAYTIPIGGRVTPIYGGINNGPVKVVSPNGTDIITSERAYRGPNYTDWNEMLGFPVEQLTTEYWFPLYDTTGIAQTFLSIGNASPSTAAEVSVYIAGQLKGSYTIPVGGRVTPIYHGINNGPVQVLSTNGVPIITSERAYRGPNYTDWNEMLGFPADQLTTEYWFPLYDTTGIAQTFISIGNASP